MLFNGGVPRMFIDREGPTQRSIVIFFQDVGVHEFRLLIHIEFQIILCNKTMAIEYASSIYTIVTIVGHRYSQ